MHFTPGSGDSDSHLVVSHGHTSLLGLNATNASAMVIALCVASVVFGLVATNVLPEGPDHHSWRHTALAFVAGFASADLAFFAVFIPLTR